MTWQALAANRLRTRPTKILRATPHRRETLPSEPADCMRRRR
ncbi:hypothetical protein AOX55_00002944 [Sinorhizobium fredii CCBAU 25509]|nr:hypothetical protein AOX55_00002944 [Sinorhizobium fredii CCBAU 25509]